MGVISEAVKGAKAEIAAEPKLLGKVAKLRNVAGHLAAELAGIASLAPYGIRTALLYRSLPDASVPAKRPAGSEAAPAPAAIKSKWGVHVHRGISYGPRPRHKLDVYLPDSLLSSTRRVSMSMPLKNNKKASGTDNKASNRQLRQQPTASAQHSSMAADPSKSNGGSDGGSSMAGNSSGAPVVLFLHGGIWASGEKWHYAPMAIRLAQEGCVVIVPSYTLFPEVLVPTMVQEVSAALSWSLDHAADFGGDPQKVTALGHSAGSHLLAAALLQRAAAVPHLPSTPSKAPASADSSLANGHHHHQRNLYVSFSERASKPGADDAHPDLDWQEGDASVDGGHGWDDASQDELNYTINGRHSIAQQGSNSHWDNVDGRQPWLFVGMSGVYDINKHYEFERSRGVHELSMMKRAMNGFDGFHAMSPSRLLAGVWQQAQHETPVGDQPEQQARNGSRSTAAKLVQQQPQQQQSDQQEHLRHLPAGGKISSESAQRPFSGGHNAAAAVATGRTVTAQAVPDRDSTQSMSDSQGGGPKSVTRDLDFFSSFPLYGDAIAARAGLHPWDDPASAGVAAGQRTTALAAVGMAPATQQHIHAEVAGQLRLEQVQRLCPVLVMSSSADHMVPWHESAELAQHLIRCGVPTRHLLYNHTQHGDFVLSWPPLRQQQREAATADTAAPAAAAAAAATAATLAVTATPAAAAAAALASKVTAAGAAVAGAAATEPVGYNMPVNRTGVTATGGPTDVSDVGDVAQRNERGARPTVRQDLLPFARDLLRIVLCEGGVDHVAAMREAAAAKNKTTPAASCDGRSADDNTVSGAAEQLASKL